MTAAQLQALRVARREARQLRAIVSTTLKHPANNADYDLRRVTDYATEGLANICKALDVLIADKRVSQ